jgi:hypothetical protein
LSVVSDAVWRVWLKFGDSTGIDETKNRSHQVGKMIDAHAEPIEEPDSDN